MFGCPPEMNTSKALFETQEKKGILHGTTLWSLAALMWVPLPATFFDLHTDMFSFSLFFLLILAENFRASDQVFDVCTQTRRLQFFSLKKKDFAHRKTSTKPDNVNNTNTMTKNLCR